MRIKRITNNFLITKSPFQTMDAKHNIHIEYKDNNIKMNINLPILPEYSEELVSKE